MRLLLPPVFLLLSALPLAAQTQFLKPSGVAPGNGYSHVVVTAPGRLAFISGQVANNAAGQLVGKGNLEAQTVQVFENLKAALAAAGTSFDHVVKLTWFIRDYQPAQLAVIREVRNRYINPAAPPASSLIGVAALLQPDYLLEVEAIAVIPEPAEKR